MGNLLSSHNKITEADRAILALKTQRRRIEDQRKRVEASIDRETAVAKELVAAGRKDRALLALKKRQLHQQQMQKLDSWLLNVESTLANVESTASLVNLRDALAQGNTALKELQQQVKLEDVEQLMEDTKEASEYQEQLQQMLGESWMGEDASAAEDALAQLEDELRFEAKLEVKTELPDVPVHEARPAAVEKVEKAAEQEVPQREAMLA